MTRKYGKTFGRVIVLKKTPFMEGKRDEKD